MADEGAGLPGRAVEEDTSSALNLANYWQVILKRWKLILACVIVSLGWAIFNTVLTRPSYRATVMLDIEQDRATPMDVGTTAQLFYVYNPDYLPTQLRLLKSREMAERAV